MRAGRISTAAEIAVAGAGLLLLFLGLWSFADPQIFTDLYGIDVAKPSATIALRAMVGGGEIGLGLFLVLGKLLGVPLRSRLLLAVCVFTCVFFARAAAVAIEWPVVSSAMIRELKIEGALAAALVALHRQIKRSNRDAG